MTTRITVLVEEQSAFVNRQYVSVAIDGDASIDHFLDVFKAAMIAAGFAPKTVQRIDIQEDNDE
jgi:hydrogenase maturation factor